MIRIHYNKNEYIIKQADLGDSLYIIADGVVGVQVKNEKDDLILASKLGVGDFFGEMSLMTGEPRTANIITENPCVVLKVNKNIMKEIISNNNEVLDSISDILAKRKIATEKSKNESLKSNEEANKLSKDIKKAIMNFLS